MAEPFRDEAGVKEFLMTTWANYAPGGDAVDNEVLQPDGSLVGTTIDGSWKMTDTYHVNPTNTHFNGREVIFKDDVPVWAANYHSIIPDEATSADVLEFFYGHVAANPNPKFPVAAVIGTQDERFRYLYRSSMGKRALTVARFAITEEIHDKQRNNLPVFGSHIIGGWIS